MAKKEFKILKNVEVMWCKLLNNPAAKYETEGKTPEDQEWTIDLLFNNSHIKELAEAGVTVDKYIKKDDTKGSYFTYRRGLTKRDGSEASPVSIVDASGKDWDRSVLIGNGSVVDVMYAVNPVSGGKRYKPGVIKIRVVKHVPYEGGVDFDYDTEDNSDTNEDW